MARKLAKRNSIAAKARALLAFAEQRAERAADWVELHNALFGLGGKATELLTTESERTAFARTAECKRIFALLDGLPPPAVKDFGELLATANGAISVRLPRSVHAALLAEAKAESDCRPLVKGANGTNPLIQVPGQTPGKCHVGDRVRILHGFRGVIGEVVEDRGPIGVRGRRLYAVKMRLDEWNEHTTELPEDALEAADE
jgi:hypothetical protein